MNVSSRAQDAEKAPTASGVNGGSDDDKPVGLTAPDTKKVTFLFLLGQMVT